MADEHRCRYCGCTDLRACVLEWNGEVFTCWWVNQECDVCSNAFCVESYRDELRAKAAEIRKLAQAIERRSA
jgi:hypothetical protein